jgi:hypothetical protein
MGRDFALLNSMQKTFTYDGDLMTARGNDSLTWDENGRMITGVTSSLTYNWDAKLQSGSAGGDSIDLKYTPGMDRNVPVELTANNHIIRIENNV